MMHFPSLSATLPRRWRTSATEGVSSATKPPKSSSNLRRRLSSLSTVSSRISSSGTPSGKPPKSTQPSFSSNLFRSSSFSSRTSSEPIPYYNEHSGNCHNTPNSIRQNSSTNTTSIFDFKKPLPPPPKSQPQRRSFIPGVLINKNEGTPLHFRRSSDTSSRNNFVSSSSAAIPIQKEWRSQSLVDLNGNTSENHQSHTTIPVNPGNHKHIITAKTKYSKPFHTFGTPQIRRKLSVPTYSSSSLTDSKDTSKKSAFFSLSSSQDGLHKISKESQGSCSSLAQPGISTATIFSKNLRSNSWRNLSLIGKVEPIQQQQKDLRELNIARYF